MFVQMEDMHVPQPGQRQVIRGGPLFSASGAERGQPARHIQNIANAHGQATITAKISRAGEHLPSLKDETGPGYVQGRSAYCHAAWVSCPSGCERRWFPAAGRL